MNESLKEKIKRIAKDKLGIRSWRDQVDENFENGTQVAAAPFAKFGTVFGRTAAERVNYMKRRNGKFEYDNTPRDIIRNANNFFPIDFATEQQKSKVADVTNFRKGTRISDASKEAIKSNTLDENGNVSEYMVKRPREKVDRLTGNNTVDWKAWAKQKKEGKEVGKEVAKQFSEQNKKEKAKYNQIAAGINGANSYIPEGYTGKIYRLKNKHVKFGGETYVTEEQLKNLRPDVLDLNTITEVKPTRALGGQNTKYLDRALHEASNQDINNMAASAKPIHYDENGNPYVRGFTWTQTENVPKITNPNAGYLASVGADTKLYHAGATPGHWTSEGWGNPMDMNYENHVAPGDSPREPVQLSKDGSRIIGDIGDFFNKIEKVAIPEDVAKLDAVENKWFSNEISPEEFRDELYKLANKYNIPTEPQNFNEQLLETRWPLKWYQKAPSEHQPDAGEKVTIMNAGPGAKDIHRPIIKTAKVRNSLGKRYDSLIKEASDLFRAMRKAEPGSDEYNRLKAAYDSKDKELVEFCISTEDLSYDDPVTKPFGTKVDKIATPASMITAHMEDNMPRNWSMRDRSNGGQSIAGWHPNKEWSSWNAEDFANHVKESMPELYDELLDECRKEFGTSPDPRKNAKTFHNYIGQYFIDNPDYLEIMADMAEGKPLGKTFKNPYEFSNWHNQRPLPEGQN